MPVMICMVFLVLTSADLTPDNSSDINHEWLNFKISDDGYMDIYKDGELTASLGIAVTGTLNNKSLVLTTDSFSWEQEEVLLNLNNSDDINNNPNLTISDTVYWNKTVVSLSNGDDLNCLVEFEFEDYEDTKVKHTFTNNLRGDITDTVFWYLFEVKEGKGIWYDGDWIPAWGGLEFSYTGKELDKFNDELDFYQFRYKFEDLLENGFTVSEVYVGSGERFGNGDKYYVALGIEKDKGLFKMGRTYELDPEITVYYDPAVGDAPGGIFDWTNPQKVDRSDDVRAYQRRQLYYMNATDWDITLEEDCIINRIDMYIEGRSNLGWPLVPPHAAVLGVELSNDSSSTFGNVVSQQLGAVPFGDAIHNMNYKQSTWGTVNWTDTDVDDPDFHVRLSEVSSLGFGITHVDYMKVRFNITSSVLFNITSLTPENNSQIGADFDVFTTTNKALIACTLESNYNGSWQNISMSVDGDSCYKNQSVTQDGDFLYRVRYSFNANTNQSEWYNISTNATQIDSLIPTDDSQIGADFDVLVKTNKNPTTCTLESNDSGSWTNESMTISGQDCYLNQTGMTQDRAFQYRVRFEIGGGVETSSDYMDILVNNTQPTVAIHMPLNNSWDNIYQIYVNFSVILDEHGDQVDTTAYAYLNDTTYINEIFRRRDNFVTYFNFTFDSFPLNPTGTYAKDLYRLYHFDGTCTDASGHQTCGSAGTYSNNFGKFGGSMYFDDDNDYVQIGAGSLNHFETECTNGCTMSVWGFADTSTSGTLFSRWDPTGDNNFFDFRWSDADTIEFRIDNDGNLVGGHGYCIVSMDVPNSGRHDDGWHHYVAQLDTESFATPSIRVWIDGINSSWVTNSTGLGLCEPWEPDWDDSEDTRMGANADYGIDLGGYLDDAAFWNTTLSADEITEMYELGAGKYEIVINVTDNIISPTNPPGQNTTVVRLCNGTKVCTSEKCDIDCDLWCVLDGPEIDLNGQNITMLNSGNCTFATNITNYAERNWGEDCLRIRNPGTGMTSI